MRKLVVWVALAMTGCSSDPSPSPSARRAPVLAPAEPAAPEPAAPAEPPPLPEGRTLTIAAQDGVRLVGDLRAGPAPDAPLVILVHQLGSSRGEWEPLLRRLAADPALATFAFDLRGHGASTEGPEGAVDHHAFQRADWGRLEADVRSVLGYLREEEGLQPRRVAVVGSSIGASAAIVAASSTPGIHAVVALSPGRAYRGIDAITPATQLGERPLLLVAARNEAPSAEAAADLARIAARGDVRLVDGGAHGVRMFVDDPESLAHVERFLRRELGAERP